MKKMKNLLALMLAFVMLFTTTATALASETSQNANPVVVVTEQGISINNVYYSQAEFTELLDTAVEVPQTKSAAAIVAGTWYIPGVGQVVVTVAGAIVVGGAVVAVGSWVYNLIADWFQTRAFNSSAEKVVNGCNENKQNHIMNSKHNWNKFKKDPKWSDVAPILIKTLKDGEETWEKNDQYIRTLIYKGETVVVRFLKDAEGLVKNIGTAWTE